MKDLTFSDGTGYVDLIGGIDATTVTCLEAARDLPEGNFLCIRHDLDRRECLGSALRMATLEARHGWRATYFVRYFSGYFDFSHNLARTLLDIAALGHEVGLHVDVIDEYVRRRRIDIRATIERPLRWLRGIGLDMKGVAAHGTTECYRHALNYEFWGEFDPETHEGIGKLDLDRIWLEDLGLEYEASFLPHDAYLADSTGVWSGLMTEGVRPIPFERHMRGSKHDIGKQVIGGFNRMESGLLQLLIHPVWWKEKT